MNIQSLSVLICLGTMIARIYHLPLLLYLNALLCVWLIYRLIRYWRKTRWYLNVYALLVLVFWGFCLQEALETM